MAIITIAREIASLGDEVAQLLAQKTGYRLVDRTVVEEGLGRYGISPEKREKFDEKRPGFLAALSQSREDYLHYLKSIVYEEAAKGNCILLGRGAFSLLACVPGILHLRFVSPHALRLERVREFYKCDERHAEQIIRQSDRDREGFHHYFFGTDWSRPENFNIVLNTAGLDAPAAAALCLALIPALPSAANPQFVQARLDALSLSQSVITAVLYTHHVPIQFLEADVVGARVVLHGVCASKVAIDAALSASREVPGVGEAVSEIQVVQEYATMP